MNLKKSGRSTAIILSVSYPASNMTALKRMSKENCSIPNTKSQKTVTGWVCAWTVPDWKRTKDTMYSVSRHSLAAYRCQKTASPSFFSMTGRLQADTCVSQPWRLPTTQNWYKNHREKQLHLKRWMERKLPKYEKKNWRKLIPGNIFNT